MTNNMSQSALQTAAKPTQVAVIGGGAAGYFGAIAAAGNPFARVTLYEAGSQPLAKVRISGGGRCNVTHHCFDPAQLIASYPRGGKALRGAFSRFQPQDTVDWYARRGVRLKTEADGRMFPVTDNSETIVSCLTRAAQEAGVTVKTRSPVTHIEKVTAEKVTAEKVAHATSEAEMLPEFNIHFRNGGSVRCDRLLITTGSSPIGHRIARSLGHTIEPPVPSLFTLNVADKRLHQLSGVAVDSANTRLKAVPTDVPASKAEQRQLKSLVQTGPLLITHWGFSGPAVLKLSAWGARWLHGQKYRATLVVNWLPDCSQAQVRSQLMQAKSEGSKRAVSRYSPFEPLSKRLWQYLLTRAELDDALTWANLSKKQMNRLVQEITQGHYAVAGKGIFKEEFVTCGGVRLKEVNFKTMESRLCPGLYFAGEVLDIDGITGGFNFQSAWTTSWLAGNAIAREAAAPG